MKTSTRFAIAAAVTALMSSTALAADLGGNCCADLEERIAELEATTVRKGNRKVSLTLSGYVSHHVMFWDDGTQSDMYIGDGGNYGSRFRFVGSAKINPGMSAGFLFEWQSNANGLQAFNQLNQGDALGNTGAAAANFPNAGTGGTNVSYFGCAGSSQGLNSSGCIVMRQSVAWLKSDHMGTVKVGHGSTATDDLILIDLGGMSGAGTPDSALYNGGFILRNNVGFAGSAAVNWGAAIRGHETFDTARRNHVLYETPTLHGFTLQTAVAEDNFWDIALRYAGEFNGVRIAAGIGYLEDTGFNSTFQQFNQAGFLCNTNCDIKSSELKGSASILHVPTGLFATFAAGKRELEGTQNGAAATRYVGPDLSWWYIAGGVSQNFFGFGKTVLFGEYSEHKGGLAQASFLTNSTQHDFVTSNTASIWGIGINQYIDAAAMEIYLTYRNFSLDGGGFLAGSAGLNNNVNDISQVIVGTRIQF